MVPCPRFEIRRRRSRLTRRWRYWVVLIADNCEPLSNSEQLTSEHAAMTNIEAQMAAMPGIEVVKDYVPDVA